jgi:hypothetical protein
MIMVRSATRAGAEQMIRREGEPARLTNSFDTGDRTMDGDPVTTQETVYRRAQFREPTASQETDTPFGESVEADAVIYVHADLLDSRDEVRDRMDADVAIDQTRIARLATDPFDSEGNRKTDANGDDIPDDVIDEYEVVRAVRESINGLIHIQAVLE